MRRQFRTLKHGRNQRAFLEQNWEFRVYRHELSVVVLEKENEQLREELQCCVQECETLQKENIFVKTQMSVSVSKQPQQQASPFLQRTTDRRYSKGHERRLKRSRAQHCDLSLGWLGRQGYTLTKVEAVNNQTSETELVYQTKEDLQCVSGSDSDSSTVSEDDVDTLNMLLFVKDRYCISGEAYHELTKICKSLKKLDQLCLGSFLSRPCENVHQLCCAIHSCPDTAES